MRAMIYVVSSKENTISTAVYTEALKTEKSFISAGYHDVKLSPKLVEI